MRMINADAILPRLKFISEAERQKYGEASLGFAQKCIAVVEDAITEESECKTGRWIKPTGMMPPEFHGHYECSECGEWAGRPWHRPWSGVVLSRCCPGCGIKMENADEEDVGEVI